MNQDLQQSFRALGDPTRRAILMQLSQKDLTIAQVVEKFELTRTAVRKHLTILEEGDLITVTQRGKERVNKLNLEGVRTTAQWFDYFDQFWDSALSSLKTVVENNEQKKTRRKKK